MITLITYELTKPEEEYTDFYNALNKLGEGGHYLHSTWIIDTEETPQQIKIILEGYLNPDDKLFIAKISSDYAGCLSKRVWRRLDRHSA
jgi:hypothetical protein